MRHCKIAVQNSKGSSKSVIPIARDNSVSTRTISSNTWVNGESKNWKLDYCKYKGLTFADVLKREIKCSPVTKVGSNQEATPTEPRDIHTKCPKGKSLTQKFKGSKADRKLPFNNSNQGKNLSTNPLTCYNRYAVFQQGDGVVSQRSLHDMVNPDFDQQCDDTGSKPTDIVKSNGIAKKASDNDAPDNDKPNVDTRVKFNISDEKFTSGHSEVISTSKYDLQLRMRDKKCNYEHIMASCPTLRLWDRQNSLKVGFIPMGDLEMPPVVVQSVSNDDAITLHKKIKTSGEYNFKSSQIKIKSQLDPDAWDSLLQGYWDVQLPLLIRFGFPLDFNRETPLESHIENHNSAKHFPNDVRAYLEEEKSYNAILGPFNAPPLPNLHTSPFMTRDKPHSKNRRVIVDLSFPQGKSVNAGSAQDVYLNTPFVLKLPTIDHVVKRVKTLGRGCMIYKIDIKRAFRHVKLDPLDYDLLGLRQDGWFLDTCLPFGFRHGSALFQRLSDAVRHMMRQRDYDVINYIDDILGIEVPSRADASFDALRSLLLQLGFEISQNKLVKPATCVNCLGILVNTKNFTLSIPAEKLQEILQKCMLWQGKQYATKRQLQSHLGSLLYVTKCVRSSRFFLNRLLHVLRTMHDSSRVQLSLDAQRDINWFAKFLPTFNGTTIFDHRPIAFEIELDASLQGLGARCGNQVYALSLPLGYMDMNIVHLEMLNILVALRVWNHAWAKSRIRIACDNAAVVQVLNSGRTRDLTLAAIARNIQLELATWDINLQVNHIAGKDNHIADLLSRWNLTEDPQIKLKKYLPQHQWLEAHTKYLHIDWCI